MEIYGLLLPTKFIPTIYFFDYSSNCKNLNLSKELYNFAMYNDGNSTLIISEIIIFWRRV